MMGGIGNGRIFVLWSCYDNRQAVRNWSVVFSMSAGTTEACTGRYVKLCVHFHDKHTYT